MIRRILINSLISLFAFLFTLLIIEGIIRITGETDVDGQFSFMGYTLQPYVLPIKQMSEKVEFYIENSERTTIMFDDTLGWVYRPNSTRQHGEFTINGAGLRSQGEYSQTPLPDTLRIALFGDSFTASTDVRDEESWGYLLDEALQQAGIRAEILNFGVAGYGMDQAYLRWQNQGKGFAPDLVLFGFQPENLNRNVNVFRQIYASYTSIPLSKPRFILNDGKLEVVNLPSLPPDELIDVYQSFYAQPLSVYEYYYQSRDVTLQWWLTSKFVAFIFEILGGDADKQDGIGPTSERGMLGKSIIDAFALDVTAQQAEFFVAHLPCYDEMEKQLSGKTPKYQYLLDYFDATYQYVPLENYLDMKYIDLDTYWTQSQHYGSELNRLVAQVVADNIQACIDSRECYFSRFDDVSQFYIN